MTDVNVTVTVDPSNQRRALADLVLWAQHEALRRGKVFGEVDMEETLALLRGTEEKSDE